MIITVSLSIYALIASRYIASSSICNRIFGGSSRLTFKHDIQTTNQSNICIYSISVLVLDSETQ